MSIGTAAAPVRPLPSTRVPLRWTLLALAIVLTSVPTWFGGTLGGIAGFVALTVAAMAIVRFDLLHPFVWYAPFLLLYHVSMPILFLLGVWPKAEGMHQVLTTSWVALAAFLVAVGPVRRSFHLTLVSLRGVTTSAWWLWALCVVLTACYLAGIYFGGLTSKFEIRLSDSPLTKLDPAFAVLTLATGVLMAEAFLRRKPPVALIVFSVLWFALAFSISGERDLILRAAWLFVLLVHGLYRRLPRGLVLAGGICGILTIPALGELKNVLVREAGAGTSEAPANPVALLIADEFVTGSDNLQTLITASPWPPFNGQTLIWDIEQSLRLGFLSRTGPSPTALFNLTFFPEVVAMGGGRGFTLVGEGYMNFGIVGAGIWLALVGVIARALYAKASTNTMWFVMYVIAMPLLVYSTRADFSWIISQFAKHIALPVVVIYVTRDSLAAITRYGKRALAPTAAVGD